MAIGKTFLLRSADSGINTPTTEDKYLITRIGTNASGANEIDFSKVLRKGAKVHFVQLKTGIIDSNGKLSSTAAIPGNDEVMTLIVADPHDMNNFGD